MKKIRTGVFETNSSSCHSVSISDTNNLFDTLYVNDQGQVVLQGGTYGWEQEEYNDPESKANYLAVFVHDWAYDQFREQYLQNLITAIKEQTHCTEVVFAFTREYTEARGLPDVWAYIDHQSAEDNDYGWICQDVQLIKQFIFDPDSTLTTDNDNH